MPTEIDKLQIEINAKATNANKSLDTLVVKLDALTSRLGKINGSSLVGLANGVNALGNSVKLIAGIDSRKFGSLATNISKISTLDTASINRAASAMHQLTRSLNSLGAVSQSAMQISQVASNVAKLGGVKVDKAITNLPKLTKGLSKFMRAMANTPQISRNIIDMTNALANLASQSRGVSTAANGLSNGLSRANNSIKLTSKSTFSLAKAFGKFYASYFLVIRGIKGLWSSIEKTADYFEAFNYFNVAFDKIAREWNHQYAEYGYENGEAYADSFKDRMEETFAKLSGIEFDMDKGILSETGLKNLGLNIQQITQYASQLASVTNSLEFTGEASVATSQSLVKLAGDISSLFNVDYSQVSSNLTSGLLGQSKALYKYGIDITQATLQTKAYELGLSKAVSEMTQGEKAQLRLLAILEQSSVAWGDQANTINSLSNQMRVMKNTWSETSMIFGQLFVPMLEDALPVINGIIIALRRLLVEVAGFMGVEIDPNKFNTGMNESEDALDGITGELEDATEAVKEYQNQLLGFDEINKLQDSTATMGVNSNGGGVDLTQEILDATSRYEKVWDKAYENMENRAEEWADKIYGYLTGTTWFEKGQDVSNVVIGLMDFFSEAIESVDWEEVGNDIGEFLAGIDWSEVVKTAFELKFDIWKAIADVWFSSASAAPIETAVITGISVLSFTPVGGLIATKIGAALSAALLSLGGIGGLLTMDFAVILGAGSLAEIGLAVGSGIIGGIASAFLGWNFGQFLYERIADEDIGMTFGQQMSYLFTSSFTQEVLPALGKVITDGIKGIFNFDRTLDFFSFSGELFSDIKDAVAEEDWGRIAEDILNGIAYGFFGVVSFFTEPINDLFDAIYDGICDVFGIHSPAKEMIPIGKDIIRGILDGFLGIPGEIIKAINNLKDKMISFFKLAFADSKIFDIGKKFASNIKTGIENSFIGKAYTALKDNILSAVSPIFSKENWTFSGIKEGLSKAFNNAISAIKKIWNGFAEWINDALNLEFDGFSKSFNVLGKKIEIGLPSFEVTLGKLPTFATGGFPEDGLFMANHGELVGKFANGRTAVANNEQITSGIANAVGPAVYNAVLSAMSNIPSGNGDVIVTIDGKEVFRAVQKQANNYTMQTGQMAFS